VVAPQFEPGDLARERVLRTPGARTRVVGQGTDREQAGRSQQGRNPREALSDLV
jgi:hypothetical protein